MYRYWQRKFSSTRQEFAGERIPTLNEALDMCEELDLLLFLELKGGSTENVMIVKTCNIILPNGLITARD